MVVHGRHVSTYRHGRLVEYKKMITSSKAKAQTEKPILRKIL